MYQTVATKLHVPQLDIGLVQRPHPTQLLSLGLQRKLTLVAAPAGYGKTTCLAVWVHNLVELQRAIESAWYALDAEDDEFTTFFTRFVAAMDVAMPGAMPTVPTGLALQGIDPQRFANLLAEACLALPHEAVIVLDDYHFITAPEIHAVIDHLVRYASHRLHLVISTRHNPPLSISRLRAQQQLVEIRADDLRLSEIEAGILLHLRLAQPPTEELVAVLQARTEGWLAGLQLAAVAIEQESTETFLRNFQRGDDLLVLDYLFDEVLNHVPAPMHEFLLKTALVARFNVELASVLTGFDQAGCRQLLDQLRERNLFLVVLDSERSWFRYHRQFRAMLLHRAGALLSNGTLHSLQRSAVTWLVENGWMEEAIAECMARGQWEEAADLVEADRHRLQNRQEWHLLWRRIAQFPDHVVALRPGLLLGRAWILQVHGRYVAMRQLREQAAALLLSPVSGTFVTPAHVLQGELAALRGAWHFTDLPLEQRLGHTQDALAKLLPAQAYSWARGFAYISLVHGTLGQGQGAVTQRLIAHELESADLDGGEYRIRLFHALTTLAYLGGALGDLQRNGAQYLQLAIQHNLPMAMAWARFAGGWALYQRGEAQAAFDALRPIFDRPQEAHLQNLTMALAPLVAVAAEAGRTAEVTRLIEQVRQIALERTNGALLDEVSALAAHAELLYGSRQAALAWATRHSAVRAADLGQANEPYMASAQVYICAKIVLTAGSAAEIGQVIPFLHAKVDAAKRSGYLLDLIQATVLLACCYWRTQRTTRALTWMQQAVETGVPYGYRRVYLEQGADLAAMLHALIERGLAAGEASQLLAEYRAWFRSRQVARPAPPTVGERAIPVLTEREVEILLLLTQKLSNKEIARQLDISALTVRNHANSIYRKLHVTSRKQAVLLAKALHLLPLG